MKNRNNLFTVILFALACFALCPTGQAVVPPPDGGYPGGNTAEGQGALLSLTTGGFNTAVGWFSLKSNTDGSLNTAIGAGTLLANVADSSTAIGAGALLSNIGGEANTATGAFALLHNTEGDFNTAVGTQALLSNTSGLSNTAVGAGALFSNNEGHQNVAIGTGALFSNTTGTFNIALGWNAGRDLTTGNNNIDIFNTGEAGDAGTIRIGTSPLQTATYIAGISGTTASGGVAVFVDTDGKLGTLTSSARFKDEIKPMDKTSEAIHALKPVTFRYKREIDPKSIPQFGLVAEEVAKVNPDLVARDAKGEIFTVRYDAVNAMLLNEFLKEHKRVEEQQSKIEKQIASITELKSTVAQQQKGVEALASQLKEQAAQIQKVSALIELSTGAPQLTSNR